MANVFLDLLKNVGILGQNLDREANLLKQKITGAIDPIAYEIVKRAQASYPQQAQQNLSTSLSAAFPILQTQQRIKDALTNLQDFQTPFPSMETMNERRRLGQPMVTNEEFDRMLPIIMGATGDIRVEPGYKVKPPPGSFPEGAKFTPIEELPGAKKGVGQPLYHYSDTKITGAVLKPGQTHPQNYLGDAVYVTNQRGGYPGKYEYQVETPKGLKILDLTGGGDEKVGMNFAKKVANKLGIPYEPQGLGLYDDLRWMEQQLSPDKLNNKVVQTKIRNIVDKMTRGYDAIKAPYYDPIEPVVKDWELVIRKKEVPIFKPTQATKGVKPVAQLPKDLQSLAKEAKKYKSAEELVSKNYGITKIENAHNAAWISPSGKLTGNLADHQESAVSTLRKLGFSPSDEYNAVQQLQKETGTIRFHMSEHEINIDVASKITPEQLRTIQKVVKEYPELDFVFDIRNPQTREIIKSGNNLTDFTQGIKSQLTDFYTQVIKGVKPVAQLPKDLQSLAQEARKFKSAEELVNTKSIQKELLSTLKKYNPDNKWVEVTVNPNKVYQFGNSGGGQVERWMVDLRNLKTGKAKDVYTGTFKEALKYPDNPIILNDVKKDGGISILDGIHRFVNAKYENKPIRAYIPEGKLTDFFTQAVKGVKYGR